MPMSTSTPTDFLYKVGDKVLVRDDFVPGMRYAMRNDPSITMDFATRMEEYYDSYVTIAAYYNGRYLIEEDGWDCKWTDNMFVGLYQDCSMPDPDTSYLDFDWS